FRIYHPGLGRFLSVDPLAGEFPWVSPFNFTENSPILFIDMKGDSLDVNGNTKEAISDIYSLVDESYHSRISVNGTRVNFDKSGLGDEELANDSGLALLAGLTSAEENYVYSVSNTAKIKNRKTGEIFDQDLSEGDQVSNISVTPRLPAPLSPGGTTVLEGVEAEVTIHPHLRLYEYNSEGEVVEKSRASIVFHELQESYERTTNKLPYMDPKTNTGAHTIAIDKEANFHKKSHQPGKARRY
nr:hypothetical protein [Ignavibacteria bacterium]